MSIPNETQVTTYPALVGNVLGRLRKIRNLDQGKFAEQLGLSQSAWSRIERGVAVINVEQLTNAATMLDVTAGEVLTETDAAKREFEAGGGRVVPKREIEILSPGMKLAGAAAIGALLATLARR